MIDAGKIQTIKTPGGQRRIPESEVFRLLGQPVAEPQTCALYARVSSKKIKRHRALRSTDGAVKRIC